MRVDINIHNMYNNFFLFNVHILKEINIIYIPTKSHLQLVVGDYEILIN